MPLQSTSGAASYDAFGGGVAAVPKYIEDYFSTFLYQGTSASNTINNGIDLSTKGGLVWIKQRNQATSHRLFDTVRGVQNSLASNSTAATASFSGYLTAFNTNGFTVGSANDVNESGFPLTSWSWAKAPKFFDVVTYTGTGSVQNIAHSLGSTPGCIFIKCTSSADYWIVYHRGLTNPEQSALYLNDTSGQFSGSVIWNNTLPTSTQFTIGTYSRLNTSGASYVAYLFAHDAGGFGLTGTDNVISCGSYTGAGANLNINLGYEPQWVMIKSTTNAVNWVMFDNMRGLPVSGDAKDLRPNLTDAEGDNPAIGITSTGFLARTGIDGQVNANGYSYIYIAIRRGPMKVPTSGTSVFAPVASASGGGTITTGFVTDSSWSNIRAGNSNNSEVASRLTGWMPYLRTASTAAESNAGINKFKSDSNTGFTDTLWEGIGSTIYWNFRRAPSFFDEVCYTGTGVARTVTHNLGVAPEMYIIKRRDGTGTNWVIYSAYLATPNNKNLYFTTAGESTNANVWSSPTSTTFGIGTGLQSAAALNASGGSYVAYLFASCAGVSKCGTFTGNGSSQTINCGFTGGARFVMIKATSTTGDWMVADSARGIVSGNDPYLELNNTNAEVTGEDWLDTDSTGFVVNEVSGSNANTNGVTYIYLAIA